MEAVTIRSTSFPDAHELPNKGGRPPSGRHKSPGNNSGSKQGRLRPAALPAARKQDQETTADRQMMLIIGPDGKRHWARMEHLDARLAEIKAQYELRQLSRGG